MKHYYSKQYEESDKKNKRGQMYWTQNNIILTNKKFSSWSFSATLYFVFCVLWSSRFWSIYSHGWHCLTNLILLYFIVYAFASLWHIIWQIKHRRAYIDNGINTYRIHDIKLSLHSVHDKTDAQIWRNNRLINEYEKNGIYIHG